MKLDYITGSPPKPSHFTVLVRGIPKTIGEPLGDTIRNFFLHYHGSSYLGHQIICRRGKLQNFFVSIFTLCSLLFSEVFNVQLRCYTLLHVYQHVAYVSCLRAIYPNVMNS